MFHEQEEKHYSMISRSMILASDVNLNRQATKFEIAIEDIFRKFFYHYNTAFMIYKTKIVTSNSESIAPITDHASLNVVARAAYESYLIFYWIFVSTNTSQETKSFRYLIWKLTSLHWRINLTLDNDNARTVIANDKVYADKLILELKSSQLYKQLTEEQKHSCMKRISEGRVPYGRPSWKELMRQSGIDPFFCQIYSYLCEYSHTGSISTIQIRESAANIEQEEQCHATLTMNMVIGSKFIRAYCSIFQESNSTLKQEIELFDTVQFYANIGEMQLAPHNA